MIYHVKRDQCFIPAEKKDKLFMDGKPGDAQCQPMHKRLFPGVQAYSTMRCIPQKGLPQGVGFCRLRGAKNGSCPLYKAKTGVVSGSWQKGSKFVSSGSFEYKCDRGLYCKVTKKGGWFKNWDIYSSYEGKCRVR